MKILITGSNGLLGQKLLHKLRLDKDIDLHASSIGDNRVTVKEGYAYHSLDITNKQEVYDLIYKIKPNVILNTAAMTNVDECEIKSMLKLKIISSFIVHLLLVTVRLN